MIGRRKFSKGERSEKVDSAAFTLWISTGSLMRAAAEMRSKGIFKPDGSPYTHMGVRYCALRHMTRNFHTSCEAVYESYAKNGRSPNIDGIEEILISYAAEVLQNPEEFLGWAKMNEIYESHQTYIDSLIDRLNDKIAERKRKQLES